jgi:CRISPR-associated protein Csx3
MIELNRLEIAGYQILEMLAVPRSQPIQPSELKTLQLPADLDLHREVILFGAMPNWVYGALIEQCKKASWLGCYAALEGSAIVIHSQLSALQPGDRVSILQNPQPCPAILIGGPPNSGKSVLSKALFNRLRMALSNSQVYLHRANWDGEGNWTHETKDKNLIQQLIAENERRIHERPDAAQHLQPYFDYHSQATANLRSLVNLVLVDVGGKTQPEKIPLLQQCTHYIIISRAPTLIQPWHDFCQPTLKPIAVIHSVREAKLEVIQVEPWLEIIAGPWEQGNVVTVADELVQAVLNELLAWQQKR